MGDLTLCHVINGDMLLLKMATRGISKGKWNAAGGKIDPGETPEQCAIREVFEETGLKVSNLTNHGPLKFHMDGKDDLSFTVHLFSTKSFDGSIKSTDEGEVKWMGIDSIPYGQMWDDDIYWIGPMLKNKKFAIDFYYDRENKKVIKCVVDLEKIS
jgi:8-oxo-dGTP diphosphatase